MAAIIPFPVRGGAWECEERQGLGSLQEMLRDEGIKVDFEEGVSDEGDPWAVLYSVEDGTALAHVARWRSGVILLWADGSIVRASSVANLRSAVRRAIGRSDTTRKYRR
jgi:hypothetical protein